jgi:hypothetical protein
LDDAGRNEVCKRHAGLLKLTKEKLEGVKPHLTAIFYEAWREGLRQFSPAAALADNAVVTKRLPATRRSRSYQIRRNWRHPLAIAMRRQRALKANMQEAQAEENERLPDDVEDFPSGGIIGPVLPILEP